MLKEEKIFISSGGIQLEGLLSVQEALSNRGGVIFCHPHPLYGGDMENPVIAAAVDAAAEEGFSTLRFNFRGVDRSGGSYGEGIGEREDVESVIELICSKLGPPDPSIILLGYSFGAWVGFPVAILDGRIRGLIGIAPPLKMYDFGFLAESTKEKLFIAGDQDLYCPAQLLEEWYQDLKEPKSLTLIPGADHFFFSHLRSLAKPLREFFRRMKQSPESAPP
jgi:uncharacterized protein